MLIACEKQPKVAQGKADCYLDLNAAGYEESLSLIRDFADALLDDGKQTETL